MERAFFWLVNHYYVMKDLERAETLYIPPPYFTNTYTYTHTHTNHLTAETH